LLLFQSQKLDHIINKKLYIIFLKSSLVRQITLATLFQLLRML